ncbi:MAG: TolC family protein [Bryobacteraceae bacterium]
MRKSYALIAWMLAAGSAFAQLNMPDFSRNHGSWYSGLMRDYQPRYVPPVDFSNTNRLDQLMRAGRIYLSLQDAIALALENNLDIEYARYGIPIAESDQLRASAGQLLRGLNTTIIQGPSSASSGVLAGANSLNNTGTTNGAASQSGILSGVSVQLAGAPIPNLDPTFYIQENAYHITQPLTSTFVTGTSTLVTTSNSPVIGIQKGFLTGTTFAMQMTNNWQSQNSPSNDFNPSVASTASLQVSQNLLQAFGKGVNSRAIKVAANNRRVSDLVFKQQVITTVANVVNLYWDLVALDQNLKVKQQALELNQKLYEDNKKRAELGAIAPIDIVQAEAEVAAAQGDVTTAETQVLQQEMTLKSVLNKSGVDSLAVIDARVVPTDTVQLPTKEPVRPVQDLVSEAMAERPEIVQSRINIENSRINLKGTRSALLPTLNAYGFLQNHGLAGQVNTIPYPPGYLPAGSGYTSGSGNPNLFFLGGYGTVLSQLFSRNFPDYGVGFNFQMPLRNRSAQADLIRDELNLRQQQISDRQLQNNIKLNVVNARVAVEQARAAYDTAVKARMLQEQTLNGARRKYQVGTSSFLDVVLVQRDLVTRQSAEVAALNTYVKSKTSLEAMTGEILKDHDVSLDEALAGKVNRPPSPLPVLEPGTH